MKNCKLGGNSDAFKSFIIGIGRLQNIKKLILNFSYNQLEIIKYFKFMMENCFIKLKNLEYLDLDFSNNTCDYD